MEEQAGRHLEKRDKERQCLSRASYTLSKEEKKACVKACHWKDMHKSTFIYTQSITNIYKK